MAKVARSAADAIDGETKKLSFSTDLDSINLQFDTNLRGTAEVNWDSSQAIQVHFILDFARLT